LYVHAYVYVYMCATCACNNDDVAKHTIGQDKENKNKKASVWDDFMYVRVCDMCIQA